MNIKDLLKDAYKEDMTLEEIESALESIELPTDNSAEIEKLKNALSKSNSEAADYKRQLKEKMTADEIKAKEEAEERERILRENEEFKKQIAVSNNKAKLLALGYEDALATETAEAMANGELDKVFANQKKHLDAMEKKVRSEILKNTPKPDGGSSDDDTMTKEKLRGMSTQERYKYSIEHPDEYKEIYGGK
jgi:hypothetical protein